MSRANRAIWAFAGASGLAFAALTITAVIHGYEQTIAIIGLLSIGWIAALIGDSFKIIPKAGFVAAFLAVVTQAVFIDQYFLANPEYASIRVPFGLSAQMWTVLASPLAGLAGAVLATIGAAPILIAKAIRHRITLPKGRT